MPATYSPIATTTLSSAASSISFTGIANSWTDIKCVFVGQNASADATFYVRFNNDASTNYSYTELNANGSTVSSFSGTSSNQILMRLVRTSQPSFIEFSVFSYAGSTYKTTLGIGHSDQNGSGNVVSTVGLWRSTAAINRIDLTMSGGGNFTAGTTATLYGIKAA